MKNRLIFGAVLTAILATAGVLPAQAFPEVPAVGSVTRVPTGRPNTTVLGNLTVDAALRAGHLRAYPCDSARPEASALNYGPGQPIANFLAIRTDAKGEFCVYTVSPTHIVFDVTGTSSTVTSVVPTRTLDTRGGSRLGGSSVVRVPTGRPNATVLGNLTATASTGVGHLTAYSCASPRPTASAVNFQAGQSIANFVAIATDAKGEFCVYTSTPTHVVFDVNGTAQGIESQAPQRVLETRSGPQPGAGSVTRVATGRANSTVLGNVTAVAPAARGHLRVYPCAQAMPATSSLNYAPGQTIANFLAVRTDAKGEFCIYTASPTHLLFDLSATASGITTTTPTRVMDTRDNSEVLSTPGAIDTTNRLAVVLAYRKWLAPTFGVPANWTGSTATCNAGSVDAAYDQATLQAINYFRAIAGQTPVTMDPSLTAGARQAALMMAANGQLTHSPPTTWRCYTKAGADAAGASNLSWSSGPWAIDDYMLDWSASNYFVGHRRWVLYGSMKAVGIGNAGSKNALNVISAPRAPGQGVRQFSWPMAGNFPLEHDLSSFMDRQEHWSYSRGTEWGSTDFARAAVRLTGPSGENIPVVLQPVRDGYGNDTLVWDVEAPFTRPEGRYAIEISGIMAPDSPTNCWGTDCPRHPESVAYYVTFIKAG